MLLHARVVPMEKAVTETWITPIRRLRPVGGQPACLVHIYPTGQNIGQRYSIGEKPIVIGRGEDCDIRIQDHSVSRRHARLEFGANGAAVTDLGSTNGTFVNDRPIEKDTLLSDGDYLRVGNCIYRFLGGGNVEAEYHEEIYRLTIMDGLTQIHNQRYMLEFLDRELVRSARHGRPLALALFDIDWFKSINDQMGHLAGDYALREIASVIRGVVRREDLFARYGGEEFGLVLVETSAKEAIEVGERLRKAIEDHTFAFEDSTFHLTVSVGITCTNGDDSLTTREMVRAADDFLYQAKRSGRNRVIGGGDAS